MSKVEMKALEAQEKWRGNLQAIAEALDFLFNPGAKEEGKEKQIGFALLVFPFACSPGAKTSYVSNGEREDMLNALKEFIARAEGRITDEEQLQ